MPVHYLFIFFFIKNVLIYINAIIIVWFLYRTLTSFDIIYKINGRFYRDEIFTYLFLRFNLCFVSKIWSPKKCGKLCQDIFILNPTVRYQNNDRTKSIVLRLLTHEYHTLCKIIHTPQTSSMTLYTDTIKSVIQFQISLSQIQHRQILLLFTGSFKLLFMLDIVIHIDWWWVVKIW